MNVLTPRILGLIVVGALTFAVSAWLTTESTTQLPLIPNGQWRATNNNQALTPPMGWSSWNAFRLDINQDKIYAIADALVATGLRDTGYKQLNIDDGWWQKRRMSDGRLQIKTENFPDAINAQGQSSFKFLTDHLHDMGLRVGIYSDIGRNSCAQFWDKNDDNLPEGSVDETEVGTLGYTQQDMNLLFSEWGFDYLKLDACGMKHYGRIPLWLRGIAARHRSLSPASDSQIHQRYKQLAQAIARTQKDITFSICVWGEANVNAWGSEVGNLWRTSADIEPNWNSMLHNYESAVERELYAGPGRWNDPDMLYVGQGDFTAKYFEQARTHLSLWAMMASPLILGNDLRQMSPEIVDLLNNRQLTAINQDPGGHQASRIHHSNDHDVLLKTLTSKKGLARKALLVFNRTAHAKIINIPLTHTLLLESMHIHDIWNDTALTPANNTLSVEVPARGVRLLMLQGEHQLGNSRFLTELPGQVHIAQRHQNVAVTASGKALSRFGSVADGYRQAIAVHPNSLLQWRVEKGARQFKSRLAAFSSMNAIFPVQFSVYGDGRLLWQSKKTANGSTNALVDLDIRDIRLLELLTQSSSNHEDIQSLWLDPTIEFQPQLLR